MTLLRRAPTLRERDLPVALTFLGLALLGARTPAQPDTFFHLRAGQHIWQSGTLPDTGLFSHTFPTHPWLNHEWLSQLLLYALAAAGGPLLLTLVAGACAILAILVSWRLTRGADEVRLALLLALCVLTAPEWAVRPQALSMPILMLTMWLVLRGKIAWLPPLMVAWANAHGVVLLGVVIAGVNAAEAIVWSRKRAGAAVVVALLCIAAPAATPLGWEYWGRVAQTVNEARSLGIQEYRSAFADSSSIPFWIMLAALLGAVIARLRAIGGWSREDRLLVLVSLALGAGSMLAIRNAPFFALVAAPAISRLVHVRQVGRMATMRLPSYALLGVAAVLALAAAVYSWRDGGTGLGWQPLSADAQAAIKRCPAPIYNEYGDGGFLLWFTPEHQVFVDGRVEAYPDSFLRRVRRADTTGDYRSLFDEFRVRCAVSGRGSALAAALATDPGMTLVFADSRWVIFER